RQNTIQGVPCAVGHKGRSAQRRSWRRLGTEIDQSGPTARQVACLHVVQDISHEPRACQVNIQFLSCLEKQSRAWFAAFAGNREFMNASVGMVWAVIDAIQPDTHPL